MSNVYEEALLLHEKAGGKLGVSIKSVDGALTRAKAKIKNCLGE